ncbi:MAG: hypothetical protein FWH47_05305 [Methanomassiliicoccaceae archaeon]|nr:hypothetical protein [Methanomassiliicoccaceae archaeon]
MPKGILVECTTPDNVVAHESGHAALYSLILNDESLDWNYLLYDEREVDRLHDAYAAAIVNSIIMKDPAMIEMYNADPWMYAAKKVGFIQGSISKYAGRRDGETVSEWFNDVSANGENADDFSEEIHKL